MEEMIASSSSLSPSLSFLTSTKRGREREREREKKKRCSNWSRVVFFVSPDNLQQEELQFNVNVMLMRELIFTWLKLVSDCWSFNPTFAISRLTWVRERKDREREKTDVQLRFSHSLTAFNGVRIVKRKEEKDVKERKKRERKEKKCEMKWVMGWMALIQMLELLKSSNNGITRLSFFLSFSPSLSLSPSYLSHIVFQLYKSSFICQIWNQNWNNNTTSKALIWDRERKRKRENVSFRNGDQVWREIRFEASLYSKLIELGL